MFYSRYRAQPSMEQIARRSKIQLIKLYRTKPNADPVVVEDKISNTWWGMSWNKNLGQYADFSNRIYRGKSYVKAGAVIDLQINGNVINAIVAGTHTYQVEIKIDSVDKDKLKKYVNAIDSKIDCIDSLIKGKFPLKLKDFFLSQQDGLFPAPNEMHMWCSCPDGANMCKHVAAVLYAIGNRLDRDPLLFFKMRNIGIDTFIEKSIATKVDKFLKLTTTKSKRTIDNSKIVQIFKLDKVS